MSQTDGSGQTILVTGGAGFIGSHMVDALLKRGDRVICLDNFSDFYSPARKRQNIKDQAGHPNYVLVEGDIRDRELVLDLFKTRRPERVAHLAAMPNPRFSVERAWEYAEVNVQGTINLLDGARAAGVQNFVMASTSSIYGKTDQIPFTEEQSTDQPLAPYPATKKAGEVMGHAYHNMFGLNFTVLRFFNVYGPRVRPDTMAHIVIEAILQGKEITLFNGGEMHRDWTYIDDIITGVVAALDRPLGYEIMNIGRGQPIRLGDFVEILEELVGKKAIIRSSPAPASEPPITYASVEKMKRLLGYEPHTSILEGLTRTWEWYQTLEPIPVESR